MLDVVWMVWDRQFLKGMFVVRDAAEARAVDVRADLGVTNLDDPQGWSVRVEPWWMDVPAGHAEGERDQVLRDAVDVIRHGWGLLTLPELGTAHHVRTHAYLVVPYERRLAYPKFQFTHERELWPGFSEVLKVFRDAAWDDVSTALWFVSRQGSTGGDAPAIVIRDDPEAVSAPLVALPTTTEPTTRHERSVLPEPVEVTG